MKKILFLLLMCVFLFVNACKKDKPEESAPPTPSVPEMKVTINPNDHVHEGESAVLQLTSKHMDSVLMDNVKLPWLSGEVIVTNIKHDTVIKFDGYSTSIVTGGTKADIETVKITTILAKIYVISPTVKVLQLTVTPDTGFIEKIYPDGTDGNFEVPIGGWTVNNLQMKAINADSVKTDIPTIPSDFGWDRPNDSVIEGGFSIFSDRDTVYHFWAYGNGQVVMDSIVIKVPVYNLTEIETLLVGKKRYLAREWFKAHSGDNWQEMSLSEDSKGTARIFFPNHWGDLYVTTNGQEYLQGRGEWSIYANDTMMSPLNYAPSHIEEINDSTFIYWTRIWCFECEVDSTFHRYEYKIR